MTHVMNYLSQIYSIHTRVLKVWCAISLSVCLMCIRHNVEIVCERKYCGCFDVNISTRL